MLRPPLCSSTIIGDTIANALEFCGADVLRLNHIVSSGAGRPCLLPPVVVACLQGGCWACQHRMLVQRYGFLAAPRVLTLAPIVAPCSSCPQGDWGTQFGMLIQYLADKRPEGLNAASDEDVADLQVGVRAGARGCCFFWWPAAALAAPNPALGLGRFLHRVPCSRLGWLGGWLGISAPAGAAPGGQAVGCTKKKTMALLYTIRLSLPPADPTHMCTLPSLQPRYRRCCTVRPSSGLTRRRSSRRGRARR